MPQAVVQLPQPRRWGETLRTGAWWVPSVLTVIGFGAFIVYGTWAAFQGNYYLLQTAGANYKETANYLSPFYSPLMFDAPWQMTAYGRPSGHAWFSGVTRPAWWPSFLAFSPALLILWAPGGFRFTCYYYRGAYYKAFWQDPPSCAVGEPRNSYLGENSLPLILQNVHRYFMYLAVIFIAWLAIDVWHALWFRDLTSGQWKFGVGVGTLILALNVVLLSCYTFGCHSFRHIVGGWRDLLSKAPAKAKVYDCVSCLNRRHMLFAWMSLFSVGFCDVYVRLCSMGVWQDWRVL